MGHYDKYGPNSLGKWGECAAQDTRQQRDSVILKHSAGKEEGARFCFLEALSDHKNSNEYYIAAAITSCVELLAQKEYNVKAQILLYLDIIKRLLVADHKNDVLKDLIRLRNQAISSGKYSLNGYKEKINLNLLFDALARHFIKYSFGDITDAESGYLHKSHMLANVLIIRHQIRIYGVDN